MPGKFKVHRNDILPAIAACARIVSRKNTVPILTNVLITPAKGELRFTTSDLDRQVETSCPAVLEDFKEPLTVPAYQLLEFVQKTAEDKEITGEPDDDLKTMTLRAARSRLKQFVLPAGDFPNLRKVKASHTFEMERESLADCLASTAFASSTEETRYYLNGIFMHVNTEGHLIFAATDGHRLAKRWVEAPDGTAGMPGVIVPNFAIATILKMLADMEGAEKPVVLGLSESALRIETPDAVLITKLIDGTFPDYDRVIPQDNPHKMTVPAKEVIDALDRLSVVSGKGSGVRLSFGKDALTLERTSGDSGDASDTVSIDGCGEKVEIGLNRDYTMDVLSLNKSGKAVLGFGSAGAPVRVTFPERPDLVAVVMPMRV